MKLSIIIPVYNVEKYLRQCLDSVISQSFKDFEVLCVDDCSTDNSLKILEEYAVKDKRIKVLRNQKNLGLGLTRNHGMQYASGEYIHFIDSDDFLVADSYEKVMSMLDSITFKPEVLFFKYKTYNDKTGEIHEIRYANDAVLNKNLYPAKDSEAFDNWDRYAWLKWYSREFLEKNGILFNNYPSMEDIEYSALIYTKAESLCYVDIPVVNYRINRGNSLADLGYKDLKFIVKSFLNNKRLYSYLSDNIKYRLLGFDYYQIINSLQFAYNGNYISAIDLLKILNLVSRKELNKYVYDKNGSDNRVLQVSLLKIIMKKYFPEIFSGIVKLKKIGAKR